MSALCAESVVTASPAYQLAGGGLIPTSALHVRLIPWHVAKGFIVEHHYLHRCAPMQRICMGVFASRDDMAPLIGVLLWGAPLAANRLTRGESTLELTRMCILDCTTTNAESRCLGVAAKMIRNILPEITDLIAYSDLQGMGHKGTIYKAAGWQCDATTKPMSWADHPRPGRDRGSNTIKLRWRKVLM